MPASLQAPTSAPAVSATPSPASSLGHKPRNLGSASAHQEIFEKRRLPRLVAPIDFPSPGHPKLGAGRPACWLDTLRQTWLLAPLDFLHAVPPKNLVPVIVTSEDSASRVTSITHWSALASGVVIALANYKGIFCRSFWFLARSLKSLTHWPVFAPVILLVIANPKP